MWALLSLQHIIPGHSCSDSPPLPFHLAAHLHLHCSRDPDRCSDGTHTLPAGSPETPAGPGHWPEWCKWFQWDKKWLWSPMKRPSKPVQKWLCLLFEDMNKHSNLDHISPGSAILVLNWDLPDWDQHMFDRMQHILCHYQIHIVLYLDR